MKNNVKEILENMKNKKIWHEGEDMTDLLVEFGDYSQGYIDEIISCVCDNNVNIYNYDLWEWARGNEYYIEQAVSNFGIDYNNFNLMQLFQSAQYEFYNTAIYNNLSDFVYYAILNNIEVEEISDDILEEIENITNEVDNGEQLETYIEKINDLIKEENDNVL